MTCEISSPHQQAPLILDVRAVPRIHGGNIVGKRPIVKSLYWESIVAALIHICHKGRTRVRHKISLGQRAECCVSGCPPLGHGSLGTDYDRSCGIVAL